MVIASPNGNMDEELPQHEKWLGQRFQWGLLWTKMMASICKQGSRRSPFPAPHRGLKKNLKNWVVGLRIQIYVGLHRINISFLAIAHKSHRTMVTTKKLGGTGAIGSARAHFFHPGDWD
jgi:hypothetical protein